MKHLSKKMLLLFTITFVIATGMLFHPAEKTLELFKIKDHKNIYYINIPVGGFPIGIKGYHGGITYDISYPDTSGIYFSNDSRAVTLNWFNIEDEENKLPVWWGKTDTIVSGIQANGKYWKEIFKGGKWWGYSNVSAEKKMLYDSSLNTFRETKKIESK